MTWELVDEDREEGRVTDHGVVVASMATRTSRRRVPGGWIYRVTVHTDERTDRGGRKCNTWGSVMFTSDSIAVE